MKSVTGIPRKIVVMFDDRSWVMNGPDIQIDMQTNYYPHGWNGGLGKYNGPGEMIEMHVRAYDIEEFHGFKEKEYYSPLPLPSLPAPKPANKRTCNWCDADITAIPEDSSNCCYCGGPLNEESEPEGATKPAPGIENANREVLMLEAHSSEQGNEEDKSEDYLPEVTDPVSTLVEFFKPLYEEEKVEDILQSLIEKKRADYEYELDRDKIPYGHYDPKTGKYIPDVYKHRP